MRDIKFRLIRKGKIVGYENHMLCLNGIQLEQNHVNEWGNPHPIGYIIHDHKDQFTGLKDKPKGLLKGVREEREEKEIYEGDIIARFDGKRQIVWKGVVEWSNEGAEYKIMLIGSKEKYAWRVLGTGTKGNYPYGEVIGNKYENLELLKCDVK